MRNVLCVLFAYTVWTLLDYINFTLIYERCLLVKRKSAKKARYLWIPLMFLISYIYGLEYTGIVYNKVISDCIFLPYYFKILPVLWCYYPRRNKDILMVLFYQLLVSTISQGLYVFVDNRDMNLINNMFHYDVFEIVTVGMITLFLLILSYFQKNDILKIYFGKLSVFQYLVFCIALFVANLIEADVIMLYSDDNLIKVLSILNVFVVCILMAQVILIRESDTRRGMVIDVLDEQMKKVTGYYNEIIENETQTKKFRHDIKNLLLVLRSLVEQGENDRALEYIEKLDAMRKESIRKYDTGNFVADTLISAKATAAEDINTEIVFTGYVPNDFENVDLVILLSNVFDNALEACEKLDGKKIITIDSILQKQMWVILVKNPTEKDIKIQNNRITTTKSNKEIHGYGIQNMERIAQKYGGDIKLECEHGIFTAKIMLLLKKKED